MVKDESSPSFFSPQVIQAQRFYLDLAPSEDADLVVVCGGREFCSEDYAIQRKTFPFYSIEFVSQGQGRVDLQGRRISLSPGIVFSYGPGISQDIRTDPENPLVKYFVDFTGLKAKSFFEKHNLVLGTGFRVSSPNEIQDVFDGLVQDGCIGTGFSPDLCRVLLEYLILKIAADRIPPQPKLTAAYDTYQRCFQYIRNHSAVLNSLEQAAKECHVDRAYLCRLFKRYDHRTPYQFLMRCKMNLATEMLQDPSVLIKQVANQLGFDDPFHFSRTFKRVFGLSPDGFRKVRSSPS